MDNKISRTIYVVEVQDYVTSTFRYWGTYDCPEKANIDGHRLIKNNGIYNYQVSQDEVQ